MLIHVLSRPHHWTLFCQASLSSLCEKRTFLQPTLVFSIIVILHPMYSFAQSSGAPINIPLQTWVARPMPGCGTAPCQNIKDIRALYNGDLKKAFFFGGDHSGTSGRTELYSYSIAEDKWALEHPICKPAGQEQPGRPDEGTFVYDTLQKLIWWIPGFSHPGNPDGCSSIFRYHTTMSYSPATGLWSSSNYAEPPTFGSETGIYGVYDPVSHTIIRLVGINATPARQTYDIATNTWSTKSFPGMPTPGGQAAFGASQAAIDVVGRKIYALDPYYDVLWVYNIASDTLAVQATVPFHISAYTVENGGEFGMRLFWDSKNQILLWPQINGNEGLVRFHTYKPSTNTWEVQKPIITSPPGLTLRGNTGIYDPDQNVLMFFGGSGTPNPYLFLYRYGTGSGSDLTPPAAPTGLRVS